MNHFLYCSLSDWTFSFTWKREWSVPSEPDGQWLCPRCFEDYRGSDMSGCWIHINRGHGLWSLGWSSPTMYVHSRCHSFIPSDIEDIGTFSRMNADHAGRVDCNILDVRGALDELRSSVQELHEYMNEAEEITFDRGTLLYWCFLLTSSATPHFPMGPKAKKKAAVSMQPPRHNIPEHFPPFPDAHTFRFTPVSLAKLCWLC